MTTNILKVGDILSQRPAQLTSANGKYRATLEFLDGTLFVGSNEIANENFWESPVQASSGSFYATMQSDGNFCIYKGTGSDDNQGSVWCANAYVLPGSAFYAIIQDDGNFCVYRGTGPDNNLGLIWEAGCAQENPAILKSGDILSPSVRPFLTSDNGKFIAVVQEDGNFCVYNGTGPDDPSRWCSMATAPKGDFFAILQPEDGNFCVYKGTGPNDNQGYVWGTQATVQGEATFTRSCRMMEISASTGGRVRKIRGNFSGQRVAAKQT
jgi:hypothetical protein